MTLQIAYLFTQKREYELINYFEMAMKPGDNKQEYYDDINRSNLDHFKKWWENLKTVMIVSARDDQVCEWCKKANHSVISIEKAVIPPVPGCANPVCRCYYIGHVKKEE